MTIYEAIGLAWVIFTSALATVQILYLAFSALRDTWKRAHAEDERQLERIMHR